MRLLVVSLIVTAISAHASGKVSLDCIDSDEFDDCVEIVQYNVTNLCSRWEMNSYCAREAGCSEVVIGILKSRFDKVNKIDCTTYAHPFVKNRGKDTGCRDLPKLDKCISNVKGSIISCEYLDGVLKCAHSNDCPVRFMLWMEDVYRAYSNTLFCDSSVESVIPCLRELGSISNCRQLLEATKCAVKANWPLYKVLMLKQRLETQTKFACGHSECYVIQTMGNVLVCPKDSQEPSCQDLKSMEACLVEVVDFPDKCRVWYQIRKCAGVGGCNEQAIMQSKKEFELSNGVNCKDCAELPSLDYLQVCTSEVPACSDKPALEDCLAKIIESQDKCDVWAQIESCTTKGKCSKASVANAKSDFIETYQIRCF